MFSRYCDIFEPDIPKSFSRNNFSNKIIKFQPIGRPIHVIYDVLNENKYKICGTFYSILKELAIKESSRYRIEFLHWFLDNRN